VESDLTRGIETHVAAAQIEHFLDPGACVEHQREERVVTAAARGHPIDAVQKRFDFAALQILDRCLLRAVLEWQADDAL
jgi:hypothetical protein